MSKDQDALYQTALKSSFLFGIVKIIQIASGIVRNKFGAILLGSTGIGLLAIYMQSVNVIQRFASLGVPETVLTDVAIANEDNNKIQIFLYIVKKLTIYTGLLGLTIGLLLSPFFSSLNFNNYDYVLNFLLIAVIIFLNLITEGQLAILKGLRKIRDLALVNVLIATVGIISVISLYSLYNLDGIIPSLLIVSLFSTLISRKFINKYCSKEIIVDKATFIQEVKKILNVSTSVMLVGFIGVLFEYVVISFISKTGGIDSVGIYFSGFTILTTLVFAINTIGSDYFPRISSKINDVNYVKKELNIQGEIGILTLFPLTLLIVFFTNFVIEMFFTSKFSEIEFFLNIAIIGTFFTVLSNYSAMILIAKKKSKIYFLSSLLQRVIMLVIYFYLFRKYSFNGLGFGFLINSVLQFTFYELINIYLFKIHYSSKVYITVVVVILSLITVYLLKSYFLYSNVSYYVFGVFLFTSIAHFVFFIKKKAGFSFIFDVFKK